MTARLHRAPHQVPRYAPVLRLLRQAGPGTRVLEVGSGEEGLGTWWPHPFVGVDLRFDRRMARHLVAVRGDATRLPFRDRSFDLVVCPGVLHFLEGSLAEACRELCRVAARYALAVVPCGVDAAMADRRNLEWCRRSGIPPPRWFAEQLERGLPSIEEVRTTLMAHGRLREGGTISVRWNDRLFRLEQRLRRLPGAMTVLQPAVRLWGRAAPREPAAEGPLYERWFLVDVQAISSPPRRDS